MFVDRIRIQAKAGDGGDGCVSFRRAKYLPKGGPDGGDGGRGGDVILEVDSHTDNLRDLSYRPFLRAVSGKPGRGKQCTGRSGSDLVVKVPAGTLVYRSDEAPGRQPAVGEDGLTAEENSAGRTVEGEPGGGGALEVVVDLTRPGDRHALVRGGKGGKGNLNFASATNRAPMESTPGEPGEQGVFRLELRRIADGGFVGFPNAGKSTLLGLLSAARPKVAAYPFTTLRPVVGVVEFPGFQRGTLADIPGLIEGAHRNLGLGHDFLRHITRCSLLIFVLDMGASEGRDPSNDLAKLREEIRLYDEDLARRPWIVVANKMDLPDAAEHFAAFRMRFPKAEVWAVSAVEGAGMEELKARLGELIGRRPA
ncbi:MAG TPA: GTPase ObgE [Verrucomicrobiales bacterium]|nr:GTPase ObgE [Verrucomicrobiales bacterium]